MGLLIQTSFETSEGVPITNVYLRISSITYTFIDHVRVCAQREASISREKRLEGKRLNNVPGVSEYFVFEMAKSDTWNDITYVYSKMKSKLEESGFTVEDVLETGPTGPTGGVETGPTGTTEEGPTGGVDTGPTGTTEEGPTGTTEEGPTGTTEEGPTGPTGTTGETGPNE